MPRRRKVTRTDAPVSRSVTPPADDALLLTPAQAAALLGVKVSFIYAGVHGTIRGKVERLPHLFIGRYLRIPRTELELWLARQRERQRNAP